MQTLEVMRRRIGSAEDLYSVVRVMKALAAANIRQCDAAVESLVDYSRAVEMGFQVLLRDRIPAGDAAADPSGRWGLIVFGSDQGMCGSFNEQVVTHFLQWRGTMPRSGGEHRVLTVGGRVVGRLQDAGCDIRAKFRQPSTVSGITAAVQDLLLLIDRIRAREGIERFVLFHHRPNSAGHAPQALPLLPVDPAWLVELAGRPWDSRSLPIHTMDWQSLFAALVREHLFIVLYRAFAESMAVENANRLASMHAAEQNIQDHLATLGERYHRSRQQQITEELLDIVAGFETLAKKPTTPRSPLP